jgi:hypothetical protein
MNAKQRLNSRIRGWFPQEPYLISTRSKLKEEKNLLPLIIPPQYKVSALKFSVMFSIFWIIVYGYMFFSSFNPGRGIVSGFQVALWVIAGLAVGTISCAVFTNNQLGRLLKEYKTISLNKKDWVLLVAPMVLFFILSISVSWSIYGSPSQELLISFFAWGVSSEITRVALFANFEKKEKMRIMQTWFGEGFVLIPKAPVSPTIQGLTVKKSVQGV